MVAQSLALVSLGFSTNSRHWNKPKKKTFGAFSERPGKISSPLRQTVLPALHVAISCSVSSERVLFFFRGPFFFIADLHVMYHLCRYFILCTLTWCQRTWIVSLFYFFSLLWFTRGHFVYILFQYQARSARLQLRETADTTPLCVCLRLCVCVDGICACLWCVPRPFVVCTAACSKTHVYSLHSSPPLTSFLFTKTNMVLLLIIF